jgi:TonB family protein
VPDPINLNFPVEVEHLPDLVARLLHHAADAGCHKDDCKILVTDFVFPDGSTFPNGIQWADDLSSLFADEKSIRVVDRTPFKNFLNQERFSAKLQNSEPTARWLGKQFNATVVLVGQAKMINEDVVQLSARFLNVSDSNLIGPSSEVNLQLKATTGDFSPLSGLRSPPSLPPFPDTVNGEKVYPAGINGVGLPSCYYMPNPDYTEAAREAGFSGIVTAEGVVGSDGLVKAVRIVKGAPFGIDEAVIKTVSTWKCKPAMLEGKPVPTIVPLEMNFRSGRN